MQEKSFRPKKKGAPDSNSFTLIVKDYFAASEIGSSGLFCNHDSRDALAQPDTALSGTLAGGVLMCGQ